MRGRSPTPGSSINWQVSLAGAGAFSCSALTCLAVDREAAPRFVGRLSVLLNVKPPVDHATGPRSLGIARQLHSANTLSPALSQLSPPINYYLTARSCN